jgi:hypothetical protein
MSKETALVADRGSGERLVSPGAERSSWIASRTVSSRLIGAFFLAGFLTYGVGFALVSSVINAPDLPSSIAAHQAPLVIGAFLMLLNTIVDVGKAVLFFPILEHYGRRTALTYLAAMIVEVVFLGIGVLSLLMLNPIAHQSAIAGQSEWPGRLGSLAVQANTTAYQIAEMTLALGCIFLFSLLLRSRLIPRFLSVWGLAGYALLMIGGIAEISGLPISLALSIPGGLLEVTLGLWLIIKGFSPTAYDPTGR